MGKHSEEKKGINKKWLIIIIAVIILVAVGITATILIIKYKPNFDNQNTTSIKDEKTVEQEKLVLRSNLDYNKIIEYIFENNIVKTTKIYEQFEQKETYESKKQIYSITPSINIIKQNDEEQSIETEQPVIEEEKDLSYEEICNKYLERFSDLYKIIK